MPTHYETLGVPPTASPAEIRACYVALARRHHPDFHVSDVPEAQEVAARRMRDINVAWNALGNRTRREAYDRKLGRPWLLDAAEAAPGSPPRSSSPGPVATPTPAHRPRGQRLYWVALAITLVLFAAGLVRGSSALVVAGIAWSVAVAAVSIVAPRIAQRGRQSVAAAGGRQKAA